MLACYFVLTQQPCFPLQVPRTNVLVGLAVDQAVGFPPPGERHPEQQRVGLDHVTVAGLKLTAGDQ